MDSPIKKFVLNLSQGLEAFYPTVKGDEEGKLKPRVIGFWVDLYGKNWDRWQFTEYVFAWTKTYSAEEASSVLNKWLESLEEGTPDPTIPPRDIIEAALEIEEREGITEGEKRRKLLNLSKRYEELYKTSETPPPGRQIDIPRTSIAPRPRAETKPAGLDNKSSSVGLDIKKAPFTPQGAFRSVLMSPIRFAVALAAPRLYDEGNKEDASALLLLTKWGLTAGALSSRRQEAISRGVSPQEFDNFIKTLARAGSMPTGLVIRSITGAKNWESLAKMASAYDISLVSDFPTIKLQSYAEKSTLALPRDSFKGGFAFRLGQSIFGRAIATSLRSALASSVASTTAAAAGGVASTTATTAAVAAAAGGPLAPFTTLIGAVAGFLVSKVGAESLSKIKVFFQKNKGKLGSILAVLGGLSLGGIPGIALLFIGGALALGDKTGKGVLGGIGAMVVLSGAGISKVTTSMLASFAIVLAVTILVFSLLASLIIFIINSSAFIIPGTLTSISGLPGGISNVSSPYVGVTKSASTNVVANSDLPKTVDYTITVLAKKSDLTNIRFSNICSVLKNGPSVNCPGTTPSVPANISEVVKAGASYTFTYSQSYDDKFKDSQITDIFTVTADTKEQLGVNSADTASVRIGTPPENCPSGWPTTGRLTQGVYTSDSHAGSEAIDIANLVGTVVRSTHKGVAKIYSNNIMPYGRYVEIESTCAGKTFLSRYAHLNVISVQNGQAVGYAEVIGLMGNTGNSTGPHLHYEFRYPGGPTKYPSSPPFMAIDPNTGQPYIPKNLPNRSCIGQSSCNMNIP